MQDKVKINYEYLFPDLENKIEYNISKYLQTKNIIL
jgi:hypothetical protein